jgi:hypothetical protein
MTPFWILLILILTALALPAAEAKKSGLWFFVAAALSFLVVVLPLFVFFFSAFMVPEWKGACAQGWVDCFIVGKLGLTPLVLAATAALYRVEVLRDNQNPKPWIVVAIFLGALIATVCVIFGLICLPWQRWMLVPIYVAIWYAIRSVLLIATSHFGLKPYLVGLLGTFPFWLISGVWSRGLFDTLPDKAPTGCFIVTAASRGHPRCVGPFVEVFRHGRPLRANHQLIVFWQFEDRWRKAAPHSHTLCRKLYNRAGPAIASRIRSPWLADLVYLSLKPLELLLRQINHQTKERYAPRQMD